LLQLAAGFTLQFGQLLHGSQLFFQIGNPFIGFFQCPVARDGIFFHSGCFGCRLATFAFRGTRYFQLVFLGSGRRGLRYLGHDLAAAGLLRRRCLGGRARCGSRQFLPVGVEIGRLGDDFMMSFLLRNVFRRGGVGNRQYFAGAYPVHVVAGKSRWIGTEQRYQHLFQRYAGRQIFRGNFA